MIIKKAKYKKVKVWDNKQVSPDVYGCDNCKKEIKEYPNEAQRLEITIFHHGVDNAEHAHLCSWKCVFEFIPKIRCEYFVTLPYIYFDERESKQRGANELLRIIKKLNPKP